MNTDWFLLASGSLILGLGLFHSVLGEKYLVRRLLRRDNIPHLFGDDSFTKLTIRYAWHLLTILALGCGAILLYLAVDANPHKPVAAILAVTFVAAGLWGIVSTRARHLSWIVLIVAGLLAGVGGW